MSEFIQITCVFDVGYDVLSSHNEMDWNRDFAPIEKAMIDLGIHRENSVRERVTEIRATATLLQLHHLNKAIKDLGHKFSGKTRLHF